ncbi:divalent cation tolerance protein CutA [Evansella halocellulosilytica]|uniref:divalent cation tolerance protein CutA n=1 Tax=Evansella halocellulosilytica TaxID=2011013 RepID=UPI000BB8D1D6|nr:divalent cation tolerance protein CutA [Evansella halocellulosilytica]
MEITFVKIEVLLPEEYVVRLRDQLNESGFLTVGNYDHVISYSRVKGYWRPLSNSSPFNGISGEVSHGTECKMEFRCLYEDLEEVKTIIKRIHPYEEPIINAIPLLN